MPLYMQKKKENTLAKSTFLLFADDPCMEFPCMNGGICNTSPAKQNGYTCSCPGRFTGFHCEKGTDGFHLRKQFVFLSLRATPEIRVLFFWNLCDRLTGKATMQVISVGTLTKIQVNNLPHPLPAPPPPPPKQC